MDAGQISDIADKIVKQVRTAPAECYKNDIQRLCNFTTRDYLIENGVMSLSGEVTEGYKNNSLNTMKGNVIENNENSSSNPETDPGSVFGSGMGELLPDERLLSPMTEEQRIRFEQEQEQLRSADAREFFLQEQAQVNFNRIQTEYENLLERYRIGNVDLLERSNLISNPQVYAEIFQKLSELENFESSLKGHESFEDTLQERNVLLSKILNIGEINTDNLKNMNLLASSEYRYRYFDTRADFENPNGAFRVRIDGAMHFTTAADFVTTIDLLYAAGVRLNGLMFNVHGINGTSFGEGYERSGFFTGNSGYIAQNMGTGEVLYNADANARNWNQLNFRIFNSGGVFFNGCCGGADDVKNIAGVMKEQGVRNTTLFGRNYDGNFAGAPDSDPINASWSGAMSPLALYQYNLNSDGIINEDRLFHYSSQHLFDAEGQRVDTKKTEYKQLYYREANAIGNNPELNYMELIRKYFNKVNNDNK